MARDKTPCPITVRQADVEFMQRGPGHNHESIADEEAFATMIRKIKDLAKQHQNTAAMAIIDQEMSTENHNWASSMPKIELLERQANRCRQAARPKDPSTIDLDPHHVPDGFLRQDIAANDSRHFMSATDN